MCGVRGLTSSASIEAWTGDVFFVMNVEKTLFPAAASCDCFLSVWLFLRNDPPRLDLEAWLCFLNDPPRLVDPPRLDLGGLSSVRRRLLSSAAFFIASLENEPLLCLPRGLSIFFRKVPAALAMASAELSLCCWLVKWSQTVSKSASFNSLSPSPSTRSITRISSAADIDSLLLPLRSATLSLSAEMVPLLEGSRAAKASAALIDGSSPEPLDEDGMRSWTNDQATSNFGVS